MEEEKRLRTVAYCRVSTEDQTISLESQIKHFTDLMDNSKNMVNCGCYIDNGISGRFINHRKAFLQLLQDCELHKIDYVLCKSIKRFGRCTLDTIRAVQRLQELKIPIYFEQENLETIRDRNSTLLATMAQIAQEEYEDRSEAVKWAFKRKFEKGELIVNPNTPLGFKFDKNGKFVVVPEEAKLVRRIYKEYAETGKSTEICIRLNREGYRTAHGATYKPATILYIIKNEKYKGDACMAKWVVINGQRVKNVGQADKYYVEDHHEAIVSKELWQKANDRVAQQRKPNCFMAKGGHDPMQQMVICGKCGHVYIRSFRQAQAWRYVCNGHDDIHFRKCTNPSVRRETLEMVFVRIFNDLRGRKLALEEMQLSADLVLLNDRLKTLLEQEKTYMQLQARDLLTGPLEDEYRKLLNRIVALEDQKKVLLQTNIKNVQAENDMRKYNKAVAAKDPLAAFDETKFKAIVKQIVIYDREHFSYFLTNGQVAKVKIYYFAKSHDEIDNIEYEKAEVRRA